MYISSVFFNLGGLSDLIDSSKWTAISQQLGGCRDLRQAVGFLTVDEDSKKAAKKVFAQSLYIYISIYLSICICIYT